MNWSEEEYQDFLGNKVPTKKNKYNAQKTTVDGITFDSKREAEYCYKLKLLKRAGEIRDIGLQPRYELQPTFKKNGTTHRSITYVADFVVVNNDGTTDVIDIKGMETQTFKIKKKMFEYRYPDLNLQVIK